MADAKDVAETAEIEEGVTEPSVEHEPKPKKQRTEGGGQATSHGPGSYGYSAYGEHGGTGSGGRVENAQAMVAMTVQHVLQQMNVGPGEADHASQLALPSPAGPGPQWVSIRVVELQTAIDCVARAATAGRQAQRLAAAASRAFGDKVAALDLE